MRATSFAWRLLTATVLTGLAAGCAEGGITDDELNGELNNDGRSGDGGRTTSRDAGRDARASSSDDEEDDTPSTGGGGSTGGTVKRDGGASTGGGGSTGGTKDAGGGSTGGGGSSGLGTPIKCPSSMVCNSTLSTVLSLLDPSIPSGTNLCAMSGGFLPMAASCSTDAECSSARLTTAKCTGGSCIQPCTP